MGKEMRIIDLIMKVPGVQLQPLVSKVLAMKKTTLAVILAAVAVPAVFLSYGFVQMVGGQKIFCLNCHVNQRNVDFWRQSKVHPALSCDTCHTVKESGVVSAAMHFQFSAKDDVVTGHCMGCHKDDVDKPVGFEAKDGKRPASELIRIPHARHIKELGIKCTYCHSNIFHERRPEKFATFRPTMETCYTCHDEKKTPCESCHPGGMPSTPTMSGKVGGGKISYSQKGAGDVVFNHKAHAQKGLTCDNCHDKIFKMRRTAPGSMTMAAMYAGRSCGSCHNGKAAFKATECGRCHMGGVQGGGMIAYPGGGSGKVVFSHDLHQQMGFKCDDCHTALFGYQKTSGKITMDSMGKGRSCGGCHDGKKAFASDDCMKCHQMG